MTRDETRWLVLLEDAEVPAHLHGGLVRYLMHGIPPGDFLVAVLNNNLREAMFSADEASRAGLFQLVSFLYTDAPSLCWGSPERVQQWMAAARVEQR